jgi:hypothetical protein
VGLPAAFRAAVIPDSISSLMYIKTENGIIRQDAAEQDSSSVNGLMGS